MGRGRRLGKMLRMALVCLTIGVLIGVSSALVNAAADGYEPSETAGEAAPSSTDDLELMPQALSISGVVRDGSGAPIAGAMVSALSPSIPLPAYDDTGADGRYSISLTWPGDYLVMAQASGFVPEYYNNVYDQNLATEVTVTFSGRTGIDFTLGPAGSISGVVENEAGDPLHYAKVKAQGDDFTTYDYTGADGTYEVNGLTPGSYVVWAQASGYTTEYYNNVYDSSSATPVTVTALNDTSGIDFTLGTGGSMPPAVTTNDATSVTVSSARLNGSLTSLGTASSVTASFVWGSSSGSHPNETTGQVMTSTGAFYFDLSGLSPGTTCYYRARVVGDGTSYGAEKTFTTTATPPAVATNDATGIGKTLATLNGNLTGLGTAAGVQVSFEWGLTASYGNATAPQTLTSTGSFSAGLSGLSPGTIYYYRARAVGDGTSHGAGKSFATDSAAPNGWYEQYTTGTSGSSLYGPNRRYQTFTPATSHKIDTVSLYLYKQGAPNYTVTIGIYNVDANNKPTGAPLCSTGLTASSLTTTPSWYMYTLATSCQVVAGSKYAIVLSGNGGDFSNRVNVRYNMSGGYSRGVFGSSSNSGTTWSVSSYQDMAFKEGQSPDQSPPTITSVSPHEGMQGQAPGNVVITGSHFTGATAVSFGLAGITVNSFTVNSGTQITANITISGSATLGSRNVSVTTPWGTTTLTNGFTVNTPSLPGWYEQFTTASSGSSLYGANWRYQTFTPTTSHVINMVSLYLYKQGTPNYTVTISIYSVDANNQPTGTPLCSTTFAASSLTTTATWYTYTFATGCQVSAGSRHAIVLSGSGGDFSNRVNVRYNMSGGYSRGVFGSSSNSGGTWSASSYQDMAFKEGQL